MGSAQLVYAVLGGAGIALFLGALLLLARDRRAEPGPDARVIGPTDPVVPEKGESETVVGTHAPGGAEPDPGSPHTHDPSVAERRARTLDDQKRLKILAGKNRSRPR